MRGFGLPPTTSAPEEFVYRQMVMADLRADSSCLEAIKGPGSDISNHQGCGDRGLA